MKCKKREEDICNAATEYSRNDDYADAFESGAAWADNNPCLDKFWHKANEIPKEGRKLLQYTMGGWEVDDYDSKFDGPWQYYVKQYDLRGWMYADEFTNTITKLKDDNSGD